MKAGETHLAACHHCGGGFGDNETRIVADVLLDSSRTERIAIHEDCIPDDSYLRYPWENMMVERMKGVTPKTEPTGG